MLGNPRDVLKSSFVGDRRGLRLDARCRLYVAS